MQNKNKRYAYLKNYIDAGVYGLPPDGYVDTVIDTKTKEIVGYSDGHTFSREALNAISNNLKTYNLYFEGSIPDDMEGDIENYEPSAVKIFAINDGIAKAIATSDYHGSFEDGSLTLFEIKSSGRKIRAREERML